MQPPGFASEHERAFDDGGPRRRASVAHVVHCEHVVASAAGPSSSSNAPLWPRGTRGGCRCLLVGGQHAVVGELRFVAIAITRPNPAQRSKRSSALARRRDPSRGEPVVRCPTEAIARRPTSTSRGSTRASSGLCSRPPARGTTTESVARESSRVGARHERFAADADRVDRNHGDRFGDGASWSMASQLTRSTLAIHAFRSQAWPRRDHRTWAQGRSIPSEKR